jgi:hypothetical protein
MTDRARDGRLGSWREVGQNNFSGNKSNYEDENPNSGSRSDREPQPNLESQPSLEGQPEEPQHGQPQLDDLEQTPEQSNRGRRLALGFPEDLDNLLRKSEDGDGWEIPADVPMLSIPRFKRLLAVVRKAQQYYEEHKENPTVDNLRKLKSIREDEVYPAYYKAKSSAKFWTSFRSIFTSNP